MSSPSMAAALQIRVDLDGAKPPIWRRLLVAPETPLGILHQILQDAFGWYDCHLHMFRQGHRVFGDPESFDEVDENEADVTIGELLRRQGCTVHYDYDFGDGWVHILKLEKKISSAEQERELPLAIGGKRAGPPEDCGGIYGYQHLIMALEQGAEAGDELREQFGLEREWRATDFNLEELNQVLQRFHSSQKPRSKSPSAAPELLFDPPPGQQPFVPWTELEENLALTKLESWLSSPTWDQAVETFRHKLDTGFTTLVQADEGLLQCVPGLEGLVQDFIDADLALEHLDPGILDLLDSNVCAGLPAGSIAFLRSFFGSYLAPYRILDHNTEAAELIVADYVDGRKICAAYSQLPLDTGIGDVLFTRLIPHNEGKSQMRGALICQASEDAVEELMLQLPGLCAEVGGDPHHPVEVMKTAFPMLLGFWILQHTEYEIGQFPICPLPGEKWEPGLGCFLLSFGRSASILADAMNNSAEFVPAEDGIWFMPEKDGLIAGKIQGQARPQGWIQMDGNELLLFAGGRSSMKQLRAAVKGLNVPGLRHLSTRYGLALPVVAIEEEARQPLA